MPSNRRLLSPPGLSGSANTSGNFATRSSDIEAISGTPLSTEEGETFEAEIGRAIDVWICRAALVKSPAASRAALIQRHASIGPDLENMLECVGSFRKEVIYYEMWQHINASSCTLCFSPHSIKLSSYSMVIHRFVFLFGMKTCP